jgi:hypothetical protein
MDIDLENNIRSFLNDELINHSIFIGINLTYLNKDIYWVLYNDLFDDLHNIELRLHQIISIKT